MLKPVIAATAMLAIAGSTFVYAQQGGYRGFRDGGPRLEHRHRLSADDVSAFADARIAALKAGLELTPDQAKSWPAFEMALRNMVQLRIDRIKARQATQQQDQSQTPASPFDRLAKRADAMSKRSVALKQIADAGAPLYQSLNDAQKTRFTCWRGCCGRIATASTAASGAKAAISIVTGAAKAAGAVGGSAKTVRASAKATKATKVAKMVAAGATAICTT